MRSEAHAADRASDEGVLTLALQSGSHSAELVALCNRFASDLFAWMDRALTDEPEEHKVPIKVAVSNVAFALTDRLVYPAYLQRPELVPIDMQTLL